MRFAKTIKSTLAAIAFAAVVFVSMGTVAFAAPADPYHYTVKIHLANTGVENSRFQGNVVSVPENAEVALFDETIVITNLNYNDAVSFHQNAVVISSDEAGFTKYYVKGLHKSGTELAQPSFYVTKDMDFVVAYGVGNVVPYMVCYRDAAGNDLAEPDIFYGPANEAVYVSYKYIEGYVPNAYNYLIHQLQAPTVDEQGNQIPAEYVFTYTPGDSASGNVSYTSSVSYVQGADTITYEVIPGAGGAVAAPAPVGAGGGNAGGANANANAAGANGADGQQADAGAVAIPDEPTPTAPAEVIEIGDEQTPLSAGIASNLVYIFAGIIDAIGIAALVIFFILNKKKKKAVVTTDPSENKE